MKKTVSLILAALMLIAALPVLAENSQALTPYDETVTMDVMARTMPGTWFPEGEDFTKNVLIDYYRERLNIDFNSVWSTDNSNYTAQIDMMIAADNLPDVFYASPEQVYRMVQAGQIQPIGEAYEQYASEAVMAELGDSSAPYFSQATVDGLVYGFPNTGDFCNYMPNIYVRKDWLEKVNMEAPDTWEDLEVLMDAFKEQCGAKYGIAINSGNKTHWAAFLNPFRAYYKAWVEKDGSLTYSAVTEESKRALALMNEWYAAGYLNPEFAMVSNTTIASDIAQGYVGIAIHNFYPSSLLGEMFRSDPSVEWIVCPIPACEDGGYCVEANVNPSSYIVVNSKYEHPEAMIKAMNLWHDMWRGESGSYYHVLNLNEYAPAEENFKFYPPFWFDPPLKNQLHTSILADIWPDGDITPYKSDYELIKQWNSMRDFLNGNTSNFGGFMHVLCYTGGFSIDANIYDALENPFIDAFTGPLNEDYANFKSITDSTMQEYFVSAIMGAKNLDSDWNTFVETWKNAGGSFMTEYVNEWYRAQ